MSVNSASDFVIGSHTIHPGGAFSESGQVISVASSGGAVIVNAATPTSTPKPTSPPENTWPVIIVGTQTITENSHSQLIIGTQTLTPGGKITYGGEVLSLSPSDGVVIVSQSTPTTFATQTKAPVAPPDTSFIVGGQTLTNGGLVTVGGDILSLGASGTQIMIIGTVTVPAGSPSETGKKNAAGRVSSNFALVGLQISFIVLSFWLW